MPSLPGPAPIRVRTAHHRDMTCPWECDGPAEPC